MADVIDLAGYRQARAYRDAAELEDDLEYRSLLEGLANTYRAKALGGAGGHGGEALARLSRER
jgi:hypothetical protein